ncbi:MAG TPA: YkvA family protein [Candidatus Limnocylindria bacterium]|nr:YkvA family protein [Candidatus Limnocylindria bacterium]
MASMNENEAKEALEKGTRKAEEILKDRDKIERFLQGLEDKMRHVPFVGRRLAEVTVMASLVHSYVRKEYTDIPFRSIAAVVGALVYFVSPLDVIPDFLPIVGHVDDVAVIAVCWKLMGQDIEKYKRWRKRTGREIKPGK